MTQPPVPLRFAIIGVGAGILSLHRPALRLPFVQLVGGTDINTSLGKERSAELGCPFFPDHLTLLQRTQPDVTVILTPHPFHAAIASDCLQAGSHVLVEKPMAIEIAEADAMIAAAKKAGRLLAVVFQQRFRPEVWAAYELIRQQRLGKIQHALMDVVWPRTARYFQTAKWRGTWQGEGAGLLLNQAPHNLDLLCHFLGMPSHLIAWTRTTLHQIETEDTVQAILEWPGGALGSIHISTAELERPERLQIDGTRGSICLQPGEINLSLSDEDMRDYVKTSEALYESPSLHPASVQLPPGSGDHIAIYKNMQQSILGNEQLMTDGREGRMSLELANAMIYSSYRQKEIELPLDAAAYHTLLTSLRQASDHD